VSETKNIRIAMVLFPGLTQLDLTGPFEVLGTSPFTEINLLWHRLEPVVAQGGLILTPTATFEEYGEADVLFVPGGPGVLEAMQDDALLAFVAGAVKNVRFLTSVCTGSLVLAAAGLLIGKRATCHWSSIELLALMGAEPVSERVVEDGNIITGAGVTSGIDFALTVAGRLLGQDAAERIQLLLEYDPAPPFQSGSPASASEATISGVTEILAPFIDKRRDVAARIGREKLKL